MRLSSYQKRVIEKMGNGFVIEFDGVSSELVREKERERVFALTFQYLQRKGIIEFFKIENNGLAIEVYRLKLD